MKIRIGALFAILVVLGNLLYFQVIEQVSKFTMIRCFILTIALFMLGDLIGYFILKLPLYNYTNIFSYLSREILGQSGFMFVFSFAWATIIAFCDHWAGDNALIQAIVRGGLLPGLYYMVNHMYSYSKTDRDIKLLKRKL